MALRFRNYDQFEKEILKNRSGPMVSAVDDVEASEAKVRFPLLTDRFNIVARRYYIQKLPCVYILDAEGKVAMVNVGYGDDVSKTLLDEIRKHIGEPASDPIPGALAEYMAHTPTAKAGSSAAVTDEPAGESKASKKKKKRKKKRRKKKR